MILTTERERAEARLRRATVTSLKASHVRPQFPAGRGPVISQLEVSVKSRIPSPGFVLAIIALFVALGGGAALAADWSGSKQQVKQLIGQSTSYNSKHLGGQPPSAYLPAKHFVSSNGEHFLSVGQTVTLGRAGHFKFTSTCSTDASGGKQVTFDVTAETIAALDGNAPQAAGNLVNIHTNSDTLDKQPAGAYDQVGSASSSTEIAADGQEVDVFYNDGVNWPAGNGTQAHDCFAGYTGFQG